MKTRLSCTVCILTAAIKSKMAWDGVALVTTSTQSISSGRGNWSLKPEA